MWGIIGGLIVVVILFVVYWVCVYVAESIH